MPKHAFSPLRRLLIGGLLASVASALLPWSEAIADDARTLRIGYQKFNSINILKGSGALEKALAPQGVKVSWHEFAAGPQLLEALSTGAIDLGHAADAPSVFAQIAGGPMAIYNVYAQGNFFQATPDTPFLQLGESKYGRPILDRNLDYRTPLDEALRCGLISFDSTIRSNLSVGMPLDLLVYRNNSLESMTRKRITSDDAYYQQIRRQWSDGLKTLLAELPAPPYG